MTEGKHPAVTSRDQGGRSKHALELGFPELLGLGLTVFASVPHLVLKDLEWILKLCCRDWRETEHQASAGSYSSSMSLISGDTSSGKPLSPAVLGSGAISMEGSGHTRTWHPEVRGLEQKPLCSSGNQWLLLLFFVV